MSKQVMEASRVYLKVVHLVPKASTSHRTCLGDGAIGAFQTPEKKDKEVRPTRASKILSEIFMFALFQYF
jgi:hypothetical protein